jgi:cytochrome c553
MICASLTIHVVPGKTSIKATLAAVLALAVAGGAWAQVGQPGRLLASNCFQCHGTNGKGPGFERLAGDSASSIYNKLKSYQTKNASNDIMARHAMGYTDAQLQALANWLSTQR